jgi:hypothetical protein
MQAFKNIEMRLVTEDSIPSSSSERDPKKEDTDGT